MPQLGRPVSTWHCVRCHQTYTRMENTRDAAKNTICAVPHVFDTKGILLPANSTFGPPGGGELRYIYPALCCPNVFLTEIRTAAGSKYISPPEPCYQGKHTTNPKQVDYNGASVKACGHACPRSQG